MTQVHLTESEVVQDFRAILERVRQGVEIIIERDNRPIAVIKSPPAAGRLISEVVADLRARGSEVTMGEDFARDIEEAIQAHRQPWTPPSWE